MQKGKAKGVLKADGSLGFRDAENATKTAVIAEELCNEFDMKQDTTSDLRHFVPHEQCDNTVAPPTDHLPKLIMHRTA